VLISGRVRVRFSVSLVSYYAHVFVLVSIVIVTLPDTTTSISVQQPSCVCSAENLEHLTIPCSWLQDTQCIYT